MDTGLKKVLTLYSEIATLLEKKTQNFTKCIPIQLSTFTSFVLNKNKSNIT